MFGMVGDMLLKRSAEDAAGPALLRDSAPLRTGSLLHSALQHGIFGFALWDPDLNLIAANQRYADLHKVPEHLLTRGANARDIMADLKERGILSPRSDPDSLAEYIRDSLTSTGQLTSHISFTGGTVLEISAEKMTDGHIVTFLRDASREKMQEKAWRRREDRMTAYAEALCTFSSQSGLPAGLDAALGAVTQTLVEIMPVDRCTVWTLSATPNMVDAINVFKRSTGKHTSLFDCGFGHAKVYGSLLLNTPLIAIEDLEKHAVGAEYCSAEVFGDKARAILDVPIRRAGKLAGVLSCAVTTGAHAWSPEDKMLVSAAAAQVAAYFETDARGQASAAGHSV